MLNTLMKHVHVQKTTIIIEITKIHLLKEKHNIKIRKTMFKWIKIYLGRKGSNSS